MEHFVSDTTGLIHVIASVLSLVFGTMVLALQKGTKNHVKVGYAYVISMAVVILTSFMMYNLFGKWGVFHYAAVVSLFSISMGMIPIWTKRPLNSWKYYHFSFMYWSVIGLYAAFVSEILTRVPETPFYNMVGIATFGVMLIAGIVFGVKKAKWEAVFGAES